MKIEYNIISEYYKDKVAERSGQPYMKHIDDGISIMRNRNCSDRAIRAFMIHPFLQEGNHLEHMEDLLNKGVAPIVVRTALEYARVANSYLAKDYQGPDDKIELSLNPEVNDMLIADKMQNYQDLVIYNHDLPNYNDLRGYFFNWFKALGV